MTELELRIAEREREVRELEGLMGTPGFYEDAEGSREVITRHQVAMWDVGTLMERWEMLQHDAPPEP